MGTKYRIGSVCLFTENKWLFRSENVDDIKLAGKKQKMDPMRKKLMNNVDLDEPTSFFDHENWRCTQRECKPSEILLKEY